MRHSARPLQYLCICGLVGASSCYYYLLRRLKKGATDGAVDVGWVDVGDITSCKADVNSSSVK